MAALRTPPAIAPALLGAADLVHIRRAIKCCKASNTHDDDELVAVVGVEIIGKGETRL
jgi:hypothetical protein